MRVLVLHQFVNHNQLVDSLCTNLIKENVQVDSFNIATWEYKTANDDKLPFLVSFLKIIFFNYKLKFLLLKLFPNVFNSLFRKYTIVDIHFFGPIYFKIIDVLLQLNKKVKITIWGSDFYRSPIERKEKQREYYKKVDAIHICTVEMKNDFVDYYKDFQDKIKIAHFGIFQFEVIEKLLKENTVNKIKQQFNLPADKLVITCGSNGIKEQQHMLIIDAIDKLSTAIKESLFLLFPMTNGFDEAYKTSLETKLKRIGCNYKFLTTKLSVEDVCRLRIGTDIAINIQTTDAFSATIQEHVYAKNILIVGDWLPYDKLQEFDVFYKKTSKENLKTTLEEAIKNYSKFKEICKDNTKKISKMSSWNYVVKNWKTIYTQIN